MTEWPKLSLQFETRCQNYGARITVTVHIIVAPPTDNRTPIGRRIKNCLFPSNIRVFGHKSVALSTFSTAIWRNLPDLPVGNTRAKDDHPLTSPMRLPIQQK